MKVWIVDAFSDKPFSGNPAAVIPVEQFPSNDLCQKIAAEMNLSETAFVQHIENNRFDIRWFTPKVEVKLCGHATLATAHILFQKGFVDGSRIDFQSLSGPLIVSKLKDSLVLNFPLQETGPILNSEPFQKIIGLPIVAAVQAHDDLIIELLDEKLVRELKVSPSLFSQFDCRGVIVTAKGHGAYDFVSRFFAPQVGVDEDPVTGSAHCKLAHYWKEKLGKNRFIAYQASQRGGELEIEVLGDRVLLIGKAVTFLEGSIAF